MGKTCALTDRGVRRVAQGDLAEVEKRRSDSVVLNILKHVIVRFEMVIKAERGGFVSIAIARFLKDEKITCPHGDVPPECARNPLRCECTANLPAGMLDKTPPFCTRPSPIRSSRTHSPLPLLPKPDSDIPLFTDLVAMRHLSVGRFSRRPLEATWWNSKHRPKLQTRNEGARVVTICPIQIGLLRSSLSIRVMRSGQQRSGSNQDESSRLRIRLRSRDIATAYLSRSFLPNRKREAKLV